MRFYETERRTTGDYKVKQVTSWQIADVTILRLKFETDGITYNLGVVDNKQSPKPDQRPGNWADSKTLWEMYIDFCKFLESLTGVSYIFWAIFFIVLAGSAIMGILSIFFPIIRKGFVVVANFFGRVISSPFRALIKLIDRLEERHAQREESNAEASIEA